MGLLILRSLNQIFLVPISIFMPVFTTESFSSLNFVNLVPLLCNNKENTKKRKTLEVEDLFDSAQVKKSGKSHFNF
jgi:hypothetical protein